MNENGANAKWQGEGLQNPHRRFDSTPRLHTLRGVGLSDFAFAIAGTIQYSNIRPRTWQHGL
jgi:hypothetical protein